jgi:hypothetical protein
VGRSITPARASRRSIATGVPASGEAH